jgi:hypothetical protein
MTTRTTEYNYSPKIIFIGVLNAGATVSVYGAVPTIPPLNPSSKSNCKSLQLAGHPNRDSGPPVSRDVIRTPSLVEGIDMFDELWQVELGVGYTV